MSDGLRLVCDFIYEIQKELFFNPTQIQQKRKVTVLLLLSRSSNTSGRISLSSLAVRAGSIHLYSHDSDRVQVSSVDRVVFRPSFTAGGSGMADDMAMVRLTSPLTMTDSVQPVCLHSGDAADAEPRSRHYGVCVVAGWAPARSASLCTTSSA